MNSRDHFLYPEYELKIGSMNFKEGLSLDYYSSKKQMSDWIHVRFTEKLHRKMNFSNMQKAEFSFGYSGQLTKMFSGYVDRIAQSGREVICKDAMLKLQKKKISELYLSVSQEAYVNCLLAQASIRVAQVKPLSQLIKEKVMLENINYTTALQRANSLWKTNAFYYFDANEQFYFNVAKKQKERYEFKFGESILNISKHQGVFEMEVIPTHIDYTNRINVEHPACNGTFEVIEVRFHVTERGFPKMFVYFEE